MYIFYYPHPTACVPESYGLNQDAPSSVAYNQPGQALNPTSDYILAPEVLDAVEMLLSTAVPAQHLMSLGSNVDPLMVERVLTIFRYDDGRLQVSPVKFGAAPLKETRTGSITSSGQMRYTATPDLDLSVNIGGQAVPWLFIHTHPTVNPIPEVPSGISAVNNSLSGDLYILRNGPRRQIGILTIGVNNVIANFRNAPQPIPFSLAIRDPLKGPTDYSATRVLDTHKAAATALRLIFRRPTVSGYYTGDLRSGRAVPYLSAREQRKLKAKTGP
jgi:hypothetical protein